MEEISPILDLLRNRRSIRKFEPREVGGDLLDQILEAALRSPSSKSRRPWHFVAVTDPDRRAKLAAAKPHGSAFLKEAPVVIAVLADPQLCDVWIEDTSIATLLIQLTAESLGLGSCWVQIRERALADGTPSQAAVRKVLEIPDTLEVLSLVGLGHPAEQKAPHDLDALPSDRLHRERFDPSAQR